MNAEAKLVAQAENFRQGIDRACARGAERGHDAADVALCRTLFKRCAIDATVRRSVGTDSKGNCRRC